MTEYHSQVDIEKEISRLLNEGDDLLDKLVAAREQADSGSFSVEQARKKHKEKEANAYLAWRRRGKSVEDSKRNALVTSDVQEAADQVILTEASLSKLERQVSEYKDRHRWVEKKVDALRTVSVNYRQVVSGN